VWAALMEQADDAGIASFVMIADGTTSMYTSTGGGIIGAGFYQEVARATLAFLDAAEAHLELLQPVDVLPLPRTGAVRWAWTCSTSGRWVVPAWSGGDAARARNAATAVGRRHHMVGGGLQRIVDDAGHRARQRLAHRQPGRQPRPGSAQAPTSRAQSYGRGRPRPFSHQ
jgi:hypothetical protein